VHVLIASALFVLVLVFVTVRPWGISIGWSASVGGALALALGIVTWGNVIEVTSIVWDATLTFVALVLISLVLDAIGFFRWAALTIAHRAGKSGMRLFFLLTLLGAAVAMLFANDGAALILTPLVYEEAKLLKISTKATLAFIMASGFIADTTSIPLVVSNLVNIISADYFHWGFVTYAVRMMPVDLVALGSSVGALWLVFHRDVPRVVDTDGLPPAASAVSDPRVFRAAWYLLPLLMGGYVLSQLFHWPVALFAGAAAAVLLVLAWSSPAVAVGRVVKESPWNIVVFSLGMYVVVFGLNNIGLTRFLAGIFTHLARHGLGAGVLGVGIISGVFSAVANNLPAVLANALAVHQAQVDPVMRTAMGFANVIGSDLGPKMTPIGSLATLLWLHVLNRRGVKISWGYYIRIGLMLTVPVLLVTLTGLWAWSLVVG
jgi:arsenical pump membrane protein